MTIREMTLADYHDLVRLLAGTPGVTLRDADSYEATARYLARNPGLSFVALSNVEGRSLSNVEGSKRQPMVKVRSPLDNTSTLLSVKLGDRVNEAPVDEEAIIGCVMAGHDGRRGYLQHLVVLPEYRRQGIGAALVHTCLAALAQQGIDKTHIFVFADNIPGNAFWRAQGWIPREEINMYSFIYSGAENA